MKFKYFLSILITTLSLHLCAEESPVPSPAESHGGTKPFEELFKTVLGDTDFFICESNILVSLERKTGEVTSKEDVYYWKASKRGKNGEVILKELQSELEASKLKALTQCRAENSEADCLTRGLINNESKYAEFDYASKKAFLDSLIKNCSEARIKCNSASASTPDCYLAKLDSAQSLPKVEASAPDAKAPAKK